MQFYVTSPCYIVLPTGIQVRCGFFSTYSVPEVVGEEAVRFLHSPEVVHSLHQQGQEDATQQLGVEEVEAVLQGVEATGKDPRTLVQVEEADCFPSLPHHG